MSDITFRLPYWQNGSSDLKEAGSHFVDYINSLKLPTTEAINIQAPTEGEVNLLKRYILTWMSYEGWKVKEDDKQRFQTLRTSVNAIQSFPDINTWLTSALFFGIDPF